jgi:hypothetical protein
MCSGSMTPPDDIPLDPPAGESEGPSKPKGGGSRRTVGPESEVRGGPEAPDAELDDREKDRGHRLRR